MTNKKPTESEKVEAENLIEEACEVFDNCTYCGMCKSLCSVFSVLKEERVSGRGHASFLSKKILDKSVFECNLCKACEQKCPLNIKVCDAVLKAREAMVLRGKSLKQNEKMIENIKKHGNPFGKDGKWGGGDDELYCC